MRTVGGNDVKSIVDHIMAFLLNDALTAQFICLEMTKKPIFSELRLYLVIAGKQFYNSIKNKMCRVSAS